MNSTKILNGTLLFADFATNGCLTGEIFKYNGAAWACGTDTTGVTLAIGTLDSVAKSANGAVISGSNLILQTADATNPGIVSTTAQTFAGNKTFDGGVNLGVSTLEGAGLTSCNSITDKLAYNSTTKKFECGADAGNNNIVQRMLTDVTSVSTTLVNLNDLTINIAANEKWVIQYNLHTISPTAADLKFAVTAPAGATCKFSAYDAEGATAQANLGCGVATGLIAGSGLDDPYQAFATIVNGATAGTVTLQWAQFAVSGTSTVRAGSTVLAYKVTGADLAEIYYTSDTTTSEGDIVSLAGNGVSQVQKSNKAYDTKSLGIISTKPGLVIGEADGEGKSVIVGLSGRVPVKVSTKNGVIQPGDYITTSDIPGVGMRATRAGHVIGKALTGFSGESEGTVMVFIQNTYFDGVHDDTPLVTTGSGIESTAPTYSVPGSTLANTPVLTTSAPTPSALVPVSQSVAESDADYLAALTNTARDVRDTIIGAIMTGVHLIRDLIVLQITALRGYFDQVWTRETHTETLCVGTTGNETCITKEQLDALLQITVSASGTVVAPVAPVVNTIVTPTTTTTAATAPAPETNSTLVVEVPPAPTDTTTVSTTPPEVVSPAIEVVESTVDPTPVVEVAPTVTPTPGVDVTPAVTETVIEPTPTDTPVVTVP